MSQASAVAKPIRIGTRGSALARWQADHVAGLIRAIGHEVAIVEIKTQGDIDQRTEFGSMNAKGIFTKEIEDALLARDVDLAVHSLKDLPTTLPVGLALAATPPRESPFDGWFCPAGIGLMELPAGGRVATGSLRREAQVLALRPDLECVPIRGNVQTRLDKVRRGEADATLLAVAGLRRLGFEGELHSVFNEVQMTPAMGQGALGIEARSEDLEGEMAGIWNTLDDAETRIAVEAERAFLGRIGGGCKSPAGIYVRRADAGWRLTAMLASPDGKHLMRRTEQGEGDHELGKAASAMAEEMLNWAPPEILATLHL